MKKLQWLIVGMLIILLPLIFAQSSPMPSPTLLDEEDIIGEVELLGIVCNFFIRGDANDDNHIDISDAIFISGAIRGDYEPECWDAADTNDDEVVNRLDYDYLLSYLFKGSSEPPSPFPTKGYDELCDGINNDNDVNTDEGCPKIVETPIECIDTDSGKDLFVRGIVKGYAYSDVYKDQIVSFEDKCLPHINDRVLYEMSCVDVDGLLKEIDELGLSQQLRDIVNYYKNKGIKELVSWRQFDCSGKCIDGKCVGESTATPSPVNTPTSIPSPTQKCSETDKGTDYSSRGKIIYLYDVPQDTFYGWHESIDTCNADGTLTEYSCEFYNSNSLFPSVTYKCPNGCVNGACLSVETEYDQCRDSDGGINLYKEGKIIGYENGVRFEREDRCISAPYGETILEENYCFIDNFGVNHEDGNGAVLQIRCAQGCKDGVCVGTEKQVPSCSDSDGGENYYKRGKVEGPKFIGGEEDLVNAQVYEDECILKEETNLAEYSCEDGFVVSESYTCPEGCENGACIGESSVAIPVPIEETTAIPESRVIVHKDKCVGELEDGKTVFFGCLLDDSCVPVGYRRGGKYCELNGEFLVQKEADLQCDNNFECESNVCVSGQCISEGLIQKIINWFKGLFGGS